MTRLHGNEPQLIKLWHASDRSALAVLTHVLEDHQIPFHVKGETPGADYHTGIQLFVRAEDHERARALMQSLDIHAMSSWVNDTNDGQGSAAIYWFWGFGTIVLFVVAVFIVNKFI